jgi:hypothetical protein
LIAGPSKPKESALKKATPIIKNKSDEENIEILLE